MPVKKAIVNLKFKLKLAYKFFTLIMTLMFLL